MRKKNPLLAKYFPHCNGYCDEKYGAHSAVLAENCIFFRKRAVMLPKIITFAPKLHIITYQY